jgi:hypothetical protein
LVVVAQRHLLLLVMAQMVQTQEFIVHLLSPLFGQLVVAVVDIMVVQEVVVDSLAVLVVDLEEILCLLQV